MPTHTIELSDAQFDFIQRTVTTGGFRDASEVIDEALRLLETRHFAAADHIEFMHAKLQKGFDDYEAGRYIDLGTREKRAAYFEDVNRRGLERLAKEAGEPPIKDLIEIYVPSLSL